MSNVETALTDVEIVAYVLNWNMTPTGLPSRHPLYYQDRQKGWSYLTSEGEAFYRKNKVEVDHIIQTVHEPALERWSKQAVEKVLA